MKILLSTQYFWPENFSINDLIKSLSDKSVKSTVLTGKPNYPEGKVFPGYRAAGIQTEFLQNIPVIRLPIVPRGKRSAPSLCLNYLSFILSGIFLAPYALRGRDFDVVFVYAPSPLLQALPAILLSKIKRVPMVLWVQDLWPDALVSTGYLNNKLVLWLVEVIVKYIYKSADMILVQSEGFIDPVSRLAGCVDKIRYYPNGSRDLLKNVSVDYLDLALTNELSKHFSVVFAGNIGSAQSCQTIVSAAEVLQKYTQIKFYLIGDGSFKQEILQLIEEKCLFNVELVDKIPAERMPGVYMHASVLLLTLAKKSGLSATVPSKLQSYLSAGKPIVASCNGETARIIKVSGAGLAVPAEDPNALARAVVQLFELSDTDRKNLGDSGRRYYKRHFDLEMLCGELISVLESVIQKKAV